MAVKIKIMLDDGATMPTRATDGSVGYDVKATHVQWHDYVEYFTVVTTGRWFERILNLKGIRALSRILPRYVVCHTGIHIQPQDGYYVELLPNSRWGKRGVITYSPGQIDPDYTGEVKAIFKILPWWFGGRAVEVGDVVGQLIIRQKIDADWEVTDKLDETERGDGGFGSTEKK